MLKDEANKVIGNLPKTMDGVTFAQGTVYVPGSYGGLPKVFEFPATARWVDDKPYISHSWGEKIAHAYSTFEAATDALTKKDTEQ